MRVDRLELYNQLEELRNSKLLVYVTSTRQGLETQIANDILPKFSEHLDSIGDTQKYPCFYILMVAILLRLGAWST